jgi:O-antigen chain-terminating methyltransferase
VLVEQCREHQFDVDEADLIQYLHSLPDESVTALTAFHIVEHLPIDSLVEFLQQVLRVLKSEGVFILETPNPRNVLVGTCNFYFDPTHRNPLPREVMQFMLQSQGFAGVETLLLNPSEQIPVAEESELATRFNEYFYGPMDYGLVSWKPASTAEQEKSKTT